MERKKMQGRRKSLLGEQAVSVIVTTSWKGSEENSLKGKLGWDCESCQGVQTLSYKSRRYRRSFKLGSGVISGFFLFVCF